MPMKTCIQAGLNPWIDGAKLVSPNQRGVLMIVKTNVQIGGSPWID